MIVSQISVFVENKVGTLAEVLGVLKGHEINLKALAVADTTDFGILRIIVNEPEKVEHILREAGFTVKTTPVLAMVVEDRPGDLYTRVLKLSSAGIIIEYMYAFASSSTQTAKVVLKVDNLEKAQTILNGNTENNSGI